MGVLSPLLDCLFPPRTTQRLVRDATTQALTDFVSPTTFQTGEYSITYLLPYQQPLVQACIVEAKFHHNNVAYTLLAQILADYVYEMMSEDSSFVTTTVLVPIPLSNKRKRERGYNQTERIVHSALSECGGLCTCDTHLLKRIKDTAPQTSLKKKERQHNMHDAFAVNDIIDTSTLYVVIDDVVTTGATLLSAITTLQKAGATQVTGLALTH